MRHRRSALALMTVLIILVACLPVSSSAAKTYTGTINKDRIFFRTGPSTSSGWSTRFMKGDKVELLAVEGDFYKVRFNNKTGYVMQKFVNVSASAAAALKAAAKATATPARTAVPAAPTATKASGSEYTGTIIKDNIFFRPAPSTSSGYRARLMQDDVVELFGVEGEFYKARFNGADGYVMQKFVKVSAATAAALKTTATAVPITPVPAKTEVSASTSKPAATSSNASKYTGTIVKDNIFFRSGPSTSSGYRARLMQDDVIELFGTEGEFYKARFNGADGYVMQKFVKVSAATAAALKASATAVISTPAPTKTPVGTATPASTAAASPYTGTIIKDNIFFRTGPSTSSGWTRRLMKDEVVEILGAENDFYKVDHKGKIGYVMKSFVNASAAAKAKFGTATTAQTPAPTAGSGTTNGNGTEKLDWFSDGKSTFTAGATFQVKDVATGKVWTCKRLYAGNHLDAEPLTASDTSIMKDVYGGTFNYVRRPVLVKYNGHVYAGSMYGEPHGDYQITDNNFDGQFCIHFSGSKTSGTAVVDSAHQAAIEKALKASW